MHKSILLILLISCFVLITRAYNFTSISGELISTYKEDAFSDNWLSEKMELLENFSTEEKAERYDEAIASLNKTVKSQNELNRSHSELNITIAIHNLIASCIALIACGLAFYYHRKYQNILTKP